MILSFVFGAVLLLALLYAGYAIMPHKERNAENFVRISVKNKKLDYNEKTSFHVSTSENNLLYCINYDKNLLAVDTKNCVIRRVKTNQPILEDSVTIVKIVCKEDSSICDSVKITLKKMESHSPNLTENGVKSDLKKTETKSGKDNDQPKEPQTELTQTDAEGIGLVTENK